MFDAWQPQFFCDRLEDTPPLVIGSLVRVIARRACANNCIDQIGCPATDTWPAKIVAGPIGSFQSRLSVAGTMSGSGRSDDKARILFVEDEQTVRDHLANQLASEYNVETVADGEQALRAVIRARPDLIITDLVMPSMGGVELVKTLRNTPSTATIPILMTSGRAPDELRLEGFEGGADNFLAKPYTERELRIRIRSMLHSARLRSLEAQREAERRAEQEVLRERAALLESISDGFYAVDRDWRLTYVNQRALTYFDKRKEDLIGRTLSDAIPADADPRVEQIYRQAMQTHESATFETTLPQDERWFDVRVYPSGRGLAVNFHDITDRKRAESELRRSEQRLRAAVVAAPHPIMLHAEDGEVLEISRKWVELTGYTRDQIKTHFDWFALAYPVEEQARIRSMVAQEFSSDGEIRVGEVAIRTASGAQRIWDFQHASLGRLPDGRRLQISAAVDVTERKQTEEGTGDPSVSTADDNLPIDKRRE